MKEINIEELFKLLIRNIAVLLAVMFVAAGVTAFYCYSFLPDEYTARTTMYVISRQKEDAITSGDMAVSTYLVNDYRELLFSKRVTQTVSDNLGLKDLKKYDINVHAPNDTRIIEISVTGTDPEMAASIANNLAGVFSDAVVDIMHADNVEPIDSAVVPTVPSGPQRARTVLLVAILAFAGTFGIIVLVELLNKTLKTIQDVEAQTGLPVLARFTLLDGKNERRSR